MARLSKSRRRITGLSWKKLSAALEVENDEEQQGDTPVPRGESGYVIVKRDTWEGVEVKWELCIPILR